MSSLKTVAGTALGCIGLLGCTLASPIQGTGKAASTSTPSQGQRPLAPRALLPAQADDYGTVTLAVSFPQNAYRAQTIPLSTNALGISVRQGEAVATQSIVTRPVGVGTATASFRLPTATYSFEVYAYRDAAPTIGTSTPIASGTATVAVLASQITGANITLVPLLVPTIASVDCVTCGTYPNIYNAGVAGEWLYGDAVEIYGTNLGVVGGATPSVTFNGTPATVVVPVSSTSLQAQVPTGATVGPVVVTSDGIPSVPDAASTFWVASSLSSATSSLPFLAVGQEAQLSAQVQWAFSPGKTAANYGSPPNPSWKVVGPYTPNNRYPPQVPVGLDGRFRPSASGYYRISARIGTIVSPSVGFDLTVFPNQASFSLSIPARWTKSLRHVSPGQALNFAIIGGTYANGNGPYGPYGFSSGGGGALARYLNTSALVGRFWADCFYSGCMPSAQDPFVLSSTGNTFAATDSYTFTATNSGELMLGINDLAALSSSGTFQVTVTSSGSVDVHDEPTY